MSAWVIVIVTLFAFWTLGCLLSELTGRVLERIGERWSGR